MTTVNDMINVKWVEEKQNPIIYPPFPSPIIADPTFLPPSQTPDGRWHLFAHSLLGTHFYISSNGISWKKTGLVSSNSIRPFIFKFEGVFYLLTEKVLELFPSMKSQLEIRKSKDLINWSEPTVILKPSLPWHLEGTRSGNIGNPCLVIDEDGSFSLYYSASSVFLSDCLFGEPKYIGIAKSKNISSGYEFLEEPVLLPSFKDKYCNLGAGSIKVIKLEDGYVGFQNGIYWDTERGHSASSIRLLTSKNGISWDICDEPIIKPSVGWKKSHVYAMDIRYVDNKWVIYFNARNGWLIGKERIGMASGYSAEHPL